MKDDESFYEFYAKLNNIVNSSFNLGKKIPESRMVRKIMRSLAKQFRPKVTTIEESRKDLTLLIRAKNLWVLLKEKKLCKQQRA